MQSTQNPKSELDRKIDEYIQHLQIEKGSSPLTLRNYRHYLSRFSHSLGENSTLADITLEKIRKFRVELVDLKLGKKTQGYHMIGLRSFLKWLIKNDYTVLAPEKIDLPKIEDRQVKFLSKDDLNRLLNSPTISTTIGLRDKAILEVLFSTGLRVSELTRLDRDKIDVDRREFGIVGKGGKARVVYLSPVACEWIAKYLKKREDNYKPLFIRHNKNSDLTTPDAKMRLTPRSIQRLIKKYVRKVKLPIDATPHTLRHSFATDLLIAGADLRSVQEMLGHKNISTTQIYTHVTNKQLKNIHEKFHGKG